MIQTRQCNACEIEKEINEFRADKKKNGIRYRHKCKKCELEVKEKWRQNNRHLDKKHKHDNYQKNSNHYKKLARKWKQNNPKLRQIYNDQRVEQLYDSYVAYILTRETELNPEDVLKYPSLIECMRSKIKLERLIKNV